ncbi:tetratricopeptide repeat-containing glycosyltransferase family 2 protein [Pseudalkalibacillus sp. Hm43]|uniref:tetratricopeptide repeat-containing glycosyltransferase family 2 protein n=1 Tax=Pseudalkalibacillus sp. Hm43 TaxID=3450742 RepID=UPI003F41C33A
MNTFLSACLIVKDEEKVLKRCLESIVGIVDELIIVDTGSTDKTREIALEFTDSFYEFKWNDNFSDARNYAASKATGDWIFVLDADEFVDRTSFEQFKSSLKLGTSDNILSVQIVNFVGENGKSTVLNNHERVYKNDGSIRYYRNIHEELKHQSNNEKRGIAELQIFHSGYMKNVVIEKGKSERNLRLLEQKKSKDPIDYYYLGNEYSSTGDIDKAISNYKKGYRLKKDLSIDWIQKLLVRLVKCLHITGDYNEALEIVKSVEKVYPYTVDFKFLKGTLLSEIGAESEAISIFNEIIRKRNDLRADYSIDYLEYLPHKHLGELYEKEGNLQLAVHHYSKSLSVNDSDDYIWMRLINLLSHNVSLEDLIKFINSNCLNRSTINTLRGMRILLKVPNLEVQKLTKSFLEDPSLSSIEKESLILKNLILEDKFIEVEHRLKLISIDEHSSILSTGLFNIVDYIILVLNTDDNYFKKILSNVKSDLNIKNLLNVLYGTKSKKLTSFEEELFSVIYKQSLVINHLKIIKSLENKMRHLSVDGRRKLKKELRMYKLHSLAN